MGNVFYEPIENVPGNTDGRDPHGRTQTDGLRLLQSRVGTSSSQVRNPREQTESNPLFMQGGPIRKSGPGSGIVPSFPPQSTKFVPSSLHVSP